MHDQQAGGSLKEAFFLRFSANPIIQRKNQQYPCHWKNTDNPRMRGAIITRLLQDENRMGTAEKKISGIAQRQSNIAATFRTTCDSASRRCSLGFRNHQWKLYRIQFGSEPLFGLDLNRRSLFESIQIGQDHTITRS